MLKQAFGRVGLPYFNPHRFRNTLVQLAYELKLDAEQFKAWSQNLGYEHGLTAFVSYGERPAFRQAEIIRDLVKTKTNLASDATAEMLRRLAEQLERNKRAG